MGWGGGGHNRGACPPCSPCTQPPFSCVSTQATLLRASQAGQIPTTEDVAPLAHPAPLHLTPLAPLHPCLRSSVQGTLLFASKADDDLSEKKNATTNQAAAYSSFRAVEPLIGQADAQAAATVQRLLAPGNPVRANSTVRFAVLGWALQACKHVAAGLWCTQTSPHSAHSMPCSPRQLISPLSNLPPSRPAPQKAMVEAALMPVLAKEWSITSADFGELGGSAT